MEVIGAIIIGLIVGVIAKLITPGSPKPRGFILTTVLGIVGALVATWLGQQIGWLAPGEPANFLGAIVGAVILLLIWRQLANPR
ncbi:MAG: GlsB/YeaQ/YmgE family stress response membrane protein [Devosia sp.]